MAEDAGPQVWPIQRLVGHFVQGLDSEQRSRSSGR